VWLSGHTREHGLSTNPGALTGEGMAIGGLVTGYIGIALAIFVFPMMLAIAITNFVRARTVAQQNACINNLRIIDGAKSQWAVEHQKKNSDIPTAQDLAPYMGRGSANIMPVCPNDPARTFGSSYSINAVGTSPSCMIRPATHILP
jgi:hypothetical protein